MKAELFQVSR